MSLVRRIALVLAVVAFFSLLIFALAEGCCGDVGQWPVLLGLFALALVIFVLLPSRKR